MDSTNIPVATEITNPNQEPLYSQPTNEELTANQTHEPVVTIPITVTEVIVPKTSEIPPEEIDGNLSYDNGHPPKINAEIIHLDEEVIRKYEDPKEMCLVNEGNNNQIPPLQIGEHSEPLTNITFNEQQHQHQEVSNINVGKENTLQEIEEEKVENKIQPEKKTSPIKDIELRIEFVVERVGSRIDEDFDEDFAEEDEELNEELGRDRIIFQQEMSINENMEIPEQIENEKEQEQPHEKNIHVENEIHTHLVQTNNQKEIIPVQQKQPQQTEVNDNETLPIVYSNENHPKTNSCSENIQEPNIAENSEFETKKGPHLIEEENHELIPENLVSTNINNSPSANLHESLILQVSVPNQEQNKEIIDNFNSKPHLIEQSQSNVDEISLEVPRIEIHEVIQNSLNQNEKIPTVNQNYLNVPNTEKCIDIEFAAPEPEKINTTIEKIQNEVFQEPKPEKPKEINEVSVDFEKDIGVNGEKNVKEIRELLLSSLSGDFAETLMLMSDEEILKIFEEIQCDEGKKEDEKSKTEQNTKTKSSESNSQINNTTENPKKSKAKQDVKEASKPNNLGKQNTRQLQNSPKAEKQQIEISNNKKAVPSKKDALNGSPNLLNKKIGESDTYEECKEGMSEIHEKKNPEKKSGCKKKIVTTIFQQVEYFENEEKEEESLSKYRKNENGESKRVIKKEKMNDILSQISNLVHELNFQELEEESKS